MKTSLNTTKTQQCFYSFVLIQKFMSLQNVSNLLLAVLTTSCGSNSICMTLLGVEILLQNGPQAGKSLESQKNLSTWTVNNTVNVLQVFYGHLVQRDDKNLTAPFKPLEFVLPFNIRANYSLRPLRSTMFFCQEPAAANHDTQHHLFCRCLWSPLTRRPIS